MDRIGPISRTAEVLLVFNGFEKHMQEGKYYRKTVERLFRTPRENLTLVVDERRDADFIAAQRKQPTPCKIEYAFLFPDQSSMLVIKNGEKHECYAFTHESTAIRLKPEVAAQKWARIHQLVEQKKRVTRAQRAREKEKELEDKRSEWKRM